MKYIAQRINIVCLSAIMGLLMMTSQSCVAVNANSSDDMSINVHDVLQDCGSVTILSEDGTPIIETDDGFVSSNNYEVDPSNKTRVIDPSNKTRVLLSAEPNDQPSGKGAVIISPYGEYGDDSDAFIIRCQGDAMCLFDEQDSQINSHVYFCADKTVIVQVSLSSHS